MPISDEVSRIASALSQLSPRQTSSAQLPEEQRDTGLDPFKIEVDPAEIRRAIRTRRLRDRHFGQKLFEDPAWDMLLDLFAAELEHSRVSTSSLCIAASVAPTTALRWISKLVDCGLLRRLPDPFDQRRHFIELSERASRSMRAYIVDARAAGLPVG